MTSRDLYDVLGVGRNASAAELQRAYEDRLQERLGVGGWDRVRDAYAVLGDPRLRAAYDEGHVVGVGAGRYSEPPAARPERDYVRPDAPWERPAPAAAQRGLQGRWDRRWAARSSQGGAGDGWRNAQGQLVGRVGAFLLGVITGLALATLVAVLVAQNRPAG